MAGVLKTFQEGEDILASETNENNQTLLSKISDNAAQVQVYVESELGTIKSNISSVQATLQANIDGLEEQLSSTINSMFNDMMPNYSKGVSVAYPTSSNKFTAPSAGYYFCSFAYNNTYNVRLIINGKTTSIQYSDGHGVNGAVVLPFTVPLAKGDVIYWNANSATNYVGNFYPCCGVSK